MVASTDFNNISQKTLASLLRRNVLDIVEIELFRAVLKWSDFQCSKKGTMESKRSVIDDAIYDLRFFAMTQEEFAQNVATSGLLTAEEIVLIYNKFNGIDSLDLKRKQSGKRSIDYNIVFPDGVPKFREAVTHPYRKKMKSKKHKKKRKVERWDEEL